MKRIAELSIGVIFFLAVFMVVLAYADQPANTETTKADNGFNKEQPLGVKAVDPVSKQTCLISKNTPQANVDGKHFYFCCPGCKEVFEISPESFLEKQAENKS